MVATAGTAEVIMTIAMNGLMALVVLCIWGCGLMMALLVAGVYPRRGTRLLPTS